MATHPQNTIPGFLHAMACGADGAELDVAVTADDALVVTHDLSLVDGRIVRDHTAAELPLPSLDEVLALTAPENFWFDIEAKTGEGVGPQPSRYAALLSKPIGRSRKRHRILVRSFDHGILRAFHEIEPSIGLSALISYESDDWAGIARSAMATTISPHSSTVTAGRVARAHQSGIQVSVWTVNNPSDWTRLTEMGVDAVITDDPATMVAWKKRTATGG